MSADAAPPSDAQALSEGSSADAPKPSVRGSLWTHRLEARIKGGRDLLRRMYRSALVGTAWERRMALLFFVSIFAVIWSVGEGVRRYWNYRSAVRAGIEAVERAKLEALLQKQAEEARRKNSVLILGSFTLQLKDEGQKRPRGSQNLGEVDFVVETNGKEARDYLDEHPTQVRDQIATVLTAVGREEILTRDGKELLKRRVMDALNDYLPKGLRIENIYIERLVLN